MQIDILFSGSRGNSVLIRDGSTAVLVDAGKSDRRIRTELAKIGLSPAELSAIFITHEHSDHTGALEILSKKNQVPIYAVSESAEVFAPQGSFAAHCVTYIEAGTSLRIGSLSVRSFPIPHDSRANVGYRLETDDGDTLGIATDMGHVTEEITKNLSGCRRVILEANHDVEMLQAGPYPYTLKQRILSRNGHLSNENCGKLAVFLAENGTEAIALAHLSEHNNTPECAKTTVEAALSAANRSLTVTVARADEVTSLL